MSVTSVFKKSLVWLSVVKCTRIISIIKNCVVSMIYGSLTSLKMLVTQLLQINRHQENITKHIIQIPNFADYLRYELLEIKETMCVTFR